MVKKRMICRVGFALLCSACSIKPLKPVAPATPTPAFASWSQSGEPDKRLCVLPFNDRTGTTPTAGQQELAEYVRESFAGHLSVRRFTDAELHEIDAQLDTIAGGWENQPPQQLGKFLHCDALVYGEVTRAKRLYLGLYSQLTLEGEVHIISATTGQFLLAASHTTRFRSGTLPFSIIEVIPGAVMNLHNMTDAQLVRAIDDLGRRLAEKVPDLPSSPPPAAPQETLTPPSTPAIGGEPPPALVHAEYDRYQVQVASFSTVGEAQQTARVLRGKGYRPAIAETSNSPQPKHNVMVGPFPSMQEAQQASSQIQKILRVTPLVVQTSVR
jgi:hypothetical protein